MKNRTRLAIDTMSLKTLFKIIVMVLLATSAGSQETASHEK